MSKKLKIFALVACSFVFCLFSTMAIMPFVQAGAGEKFNDSHYCETCNKFGFEMEEGSFTGTSGDPNESVFVTKDVLHGGGGVGNFGVANNKLTWKFNVNAEYSTSLTFYFIAYGTSDISKVSVYVNGTKLAWTTDSLKTVDSDWWAVGAHTTAKVTLKENVTVEFVNSGAVAAINSDYFTLDDLPNTAVVGEYVEPTHEHSYGADGRCSCGAAMLEAETALLSGTPTDGNDTLVCSEKEWLSGKKCVCNFAVVGNAITWKFNLSKATTTALIFNMVGSGDLGNLKVYVNDIEVAWATSSLNQFAQSGDHAWYNMAEHKTAEVKLEGNTVIKFVVTGALGGINVDNMIIETLDTSATLGAYEVPAHDHTFGADGRCSCGAAMLEAETALVTGVSSDTDGLNDDMILDENIEGLSGGKCVCDFSNQGNKITWKFTLSKATTTALIFNMVGYGSLNSLQVTVNGEVVAWATPTLSQFANEQWYKVMPHKTALVTMEGEVTVVFEVVGSIGGINIDNMIIDTLDPTATITVKEDVVNPVISAIRVEPSTHKVGEELTLIYTVSDNVTAEENLTVSVKVYYYGEAADSHNKSAEGLTEVTTEGGKFTADKAGDYLAVITVTDEAGNTSTRIRIFRVYA